MTDAKRNGDSSDEEAFDGMMSENYIAYKKLPNAVKRRVHAMKNLLYKTMQVDVDFYKSLYAIEKEYEARHEEIFNARAALANGQRDPTDEEAKWDSGDEDKISEKIKEQLTIEEKGDVEEGPGVPDFWIKVFSHIPHLNAMMMPGDLPVMKHLTDVKCVIHPESEEPGFTLEFLFSENAWFTNTVLTKSYYFSYKIPEDDPFEYAGPEIVASKGCVIEWNKGKNLTVKNVVKTQRHKGRGEKRTVTKTVQNDSFFNFFNPDKQSTDDVDADEELLECDFKIGQFLRENVIPRAVLYYTGEADDEFDDEEGYTSDEDDDGQLSDESASDEEDSTAHRQHGGRNKHKRRSGGAGNNPQQEECKQQ